MISYAPLRAVLKERGISFRQIRKDLGIHATAATYLNNDTGYVSLYALEKLCRYLDLPLHEIAIYIDDPAEEEAPNVPYAPGDPNRN